MNKSQRKEVIPELDSLAIRVEDLEKSLYYLTERQQLYKDERLARVYNDASKLLRSLHETSDELKRESADVVSAYVKDWHSWRFDDEEEASVPEIESVTYDGKNAWTVLMSSSTHGRERVVIHSDTATWEQVYSADRID